ncbi:MAG: heavy-metal-associated domain-containing protein [Pedobacter sp.]|nr:heavy-metal-associated domain-containing protein [Chitinophagaceae bacterium]
MKTQNIILTIAFIFISIVTMAQASNQATVKVYGNCSSCKKHIETAAKEAGATSAVWNKDTKFLTLKFDASKTDSKKIQQKVAAAGYDTQDATSTKEAYDKLDECCQYERKAAKPTSMISNKNCCIDMASCTTQNCSNCTTDKACSSNCCQTEIAKTVANSASDKASSHKQLPSLTITTVNGNIVANTANCCAKS